MSAISSIRRFFTLTILLSCTILSACSSGGSSNSSGVIVGEQLSLIAPVSLPSGHNLDTYIVVKNNSNTTYNNLSYSIESNTTNAKLGIKNSKRCSSIAANHSCTLAISITQNSKPGSFILGVSGNGVSGNTKSVATINMVDIPQNKESGADGVALLAPSSIKQSPDSDTQVIVTALVRSSNIKQPFNMIKLVSGGLNARLSYSVLDSTRTPYYDLSRGSVVTYLLNVPRSAHALKVYAQLGNKVNGVVKTVGSASPSPVMISVLSSTGEAASKAIDTSGAVLQITPGGTYTFPTMLANGAESYTQTFTVSNVGENTATSVNPIITNDSSHLLAIQSTTCGNSLVVGESCVVVINAGPSNIGAIESAGLNLLYENGTSQVTESLPLNVVFESLGSPVINITSVVASPVYALFSDGNGSSEESAFVINTNTGNTIFIGITYTNNGNGVANNFSVSSLTGEDWTTKNTCASVNLTPGDSCQVTIALSPPVWSIGAHDFDLDDLTYTYNDSTTPQSATWNGQSIVYINAVGAVYGTATISNLNSIAQGFAAPLTINITGANQYAGVQNFTLTGSSSVSFSSNSCNINLEESTSCTVSLQVTEGNSFSVTVNSSMYYLASFNVNVFGVGGLMPLPNPLPPTAYNSSPDTGQQSIIPAIDPSGNLYLGDYNGNIWVSPSGLGNNWFTELSNLGDALISNTHRITAIVTGADELLYIGQNMDIGGNVWKAPLNGVTASPVALYSGANYPNVGVYYNSKAYFGDRYGNIQNVDNSVLENFSSSTNEPVMQMLVDSNDTLWFTTDNYVYSCPAISNINVGLSMCTMASGASDVVGITSDFNGNTYILHSNGYLWKSNSDSYNGGLQELPSLNGSTAGNTIVYSSYLNALFVLDGNGLIQILDTNGNVIANPISNPFLGNNCPGTSNLLTGINQSTVYYICTFPGNAALFRIDLSN